MDDRPQPMAKAGQLLGLRRFRTWLSTPQRDLDDGRNEIFAVQNYSIALALIAYLSFVPLFVAMGVAWIAAVNAGVLLGFGLSWILVRRFRMFHAMLLNTAIVIGHSWLTTLVLGWEGGFHFPIILTLELCMLFGFVGLWNRVLVAGVIIASYFALLYSARQSLPWVAVDAEVLDLVGLLNLAVFLLVTTGVAVHHSQTVRLSRRELERSLDLLGVQNEVLKSREEELALACERAEESSRAKSMFLANMSHELRTPLNAIIGYSDLIIEEAEEHQSSPIDESSLVSDVTRIRGAGQHLLGLISDILDLSKIESGKMETELAELDLAALVASVQATMKPLALKHGNRLQVEVTELKFVMRSDPTKVSQIALNLLSNACKFTKEGQVTWHLLPTQVDGRPGLRMVVEDTGMGMKAETLAHIFEEFAQADASTTREHGGTGLGLAIVKRFCDLLGGSISVRSEPGRGSTFTVDLPSIAP